MPNVSNTRVVYLEDFDFHKNTVGSQETCVKHLCCEKFSNEPRVCYIRHQSEVIIFGNKWLLYKSIK